MAQYPSKRESRDNEMDFQEFAGKVAVGATGIALVAGMIAVGAAMFADDKTKQKLVKDTNQAASNFRQFMNYLRKTAEMTTKTIREVI